MDLEKENAELKKTIEWLRKRVAALESQIRQQRAAEARRYRDQHDYVPYEDEDR